MWIALYESFMNAIIRFWDARFASNTILDEIEHLKLEIEKERQEKRKLLDYILEMHKPVERAPDIEISDYKPSNQHVPWRSRRMQLEQDDREKFRKALQDKEIKLEEAKSTEQLEEELLG